MCTKRVSSLKCFEGGYPSESHRSRNKQGPTAKKRWYVPAAATEESPDDYVPTAQLQFAVNTNQAHGEMAHQGQTGGEWEPAYLELSVLRETWPSAQAGGPFLASRNQSNASHKRQNNYCH